MKTAGQFAEYAQRSEAVLRKHMCTFTKQIKTEKNKKDIQQNETNVSIFIYLSDNCSTLIKTRKATGFKSLRVNFWNITQII